MAMTKKAKAAKSRRAAKLSESVATTTDTENINTSKEENNHEQQN